MNDENKNINANILNSQVVNEIPNNPTLNNQILYQNQNGDNKNKKGIKKLDVIIISIIFIVLLLGGFRLYNTLKGKKVDNNEKNDTETVTAVNQLWEDFNNGKIDIDEYVKNNIYATFEVELLPEKYDSTPPIRIDNLIAKYYDKLSENTIKLYLEYYSLPNLTFKVDNATPKAKPLANTESKATTVNLNKVYLSSKGNFLLWYTDSGNSAMEYSKVQKYGELLEKSIIDYEKTFGLKYRFKSEVISKGQRYEQQLDVLNSHNLDEEYLTEAMHVYIYELSNPKAAGIYSTVGISENEIIKYINKYLYNKEDATIISSYMSLNSVIFNKKDYNRENTLAHELFHHYQHFVIDNTGARRTWDDIIIGEATAQWAAAKVTKNEMKNNGLNDNVSNYIRHTDDILTEMYNEHGTSVGYALFNFIYSFENNVSNGTDKIFKAIYSPEGFKYLNDNANITERNKVMGNLALKNLNGDYPNNNYLPKDGINLAIKDEISDKSQKNRKVLLSAVGIDYYTFDTTSKHNYKIKVSVEKINWASVYVVGVKNANYEILSTENNIKNNITIDTADYQNYGKLYIVITNNDFVNAYNYEINFEKSTVSEKTVFNTKFNNYKIKATSTMLVYGMETKSYINGVIDEVNQKEYLETTVDAMGLKISTLTYVDFAKGYTYTKNPLNGTWEKTKGATTLIDLTSLLDKFKENSNVTRVNSEEYLVKLTKDDINGLLKYNSNLNQGNLNGDIFVKVYTKDNCVSKLEYDFSTLMDGVENFTMVIEFYDHNKAGEVSIPAEAMR